jgi:ribosomal protein L36
VGLKKNRATRRMCRIVRREGKVVVGFQKKGREMWACRREEGSCGIEEERKEVVDLLKRGRKLWD